jgi:peptide/bleomycin uptake transporter
VFRSFFLTRRWCAWSIPGGALILFVTWYKVELDVRINEWFGDFYNLIQKALGKPGSITMDEYMTQLATFGRIAGLYVLLAVATDFLIKHYVFRWRTAMNEFYTAHWTAVRGIEGASQRVQEDTMRFARLMEGLGVSFMRSIMTLIAFVPILWTLSAQVKELPWFGTVDHSLVWVAILFALAGTVLMAVVDLGLQAAAGVRAADPRGRTDAAAAAGRRLAMALLHCAPSRRCWLSGVR